MALADAIRNRFGRGGSLGSPEAFRQFFEATHVQVFRYIAAMHRGTSADAEDLTADTFERAWAARHRFSGSPEAALGWVLTIARRLVIDAHRRAGVRGIEGDVADYPLVDPQPGPVDQAMHRAQQAVLMDQLSRLPDEQREVLVLRYLLEWRVSDIAAYLGRPENTVSVIIRRALDRVRRDWPPSEIEANV